MKLIMLSTCFCLCCVFACKKDNGKFNYWGETSVLKNGEIWSGKIVAHPSTYAPSKVDIIIQVFDDMEIQGDALIFFKVPKHLGNYPLSRSTNQPPDDSLVGAHYIHGYDDGVYDGYDVASGDSTSYLEVTEYNADKGEFRGNFHVTLYSTIGGAGRWPDTLIFTNGTFHTRIDD